VSLLAIPRAKANTRYLAGCLSLLAVVAMGVTTFVMIEPPERSLQTPPIASDRVSLVPRPIAVPTVESGGAPSLIKPFEAAEPLAVSQTPPEDQQPAAPVPAAPWRERLLAMGRAKLTPLLPWLAGRGCLAC